MAGDWLKLEANTPEKEEVLAITAAMGWADADLTVGKLFKLWRWFDQHTTSGNAARVTPALLDGIIGVTGFCEAVRAVGWLEFEGGGVTLPKFDRHNGTTAKSRALTAKRVANHKASAKGNAQGNGDSVSGALPREREREDISTADAVEKAATRKRAPRFDASAIELPDWLDRDAWASWCADRRKRGKPITERAATLQVQQLADYLNAGHLPEAVIAHSIACGYQGLFAPKPNAQHQPNGSAPQTFAERSEQHARQRVAELTGQAPAAGRGHVIDVTPTTPALGLKP